MKTLHTIKKHQSQQIINTYMQLYSMYIMNRQWLGHLYCVTIISAILRTLESMTCLSAPHTLRRCTHWDCQVHRASRPSLCWRGRRRSRSLQPDSAAYTHHGLGGDKDMRRDDNGWIPMPSPWTLTNITGMSTWVGDSCQLVYVLCRVQGLWG